MPGNSLPTTDSGELRSPTRVPVLPCLRMTSMGTTEKLCTACWNGKLEEVNSILARATKVEVNGLNLRGQSALYCSSRQGHAEIVVELLNFDGIDVDLPASGHGGTALHAAGAEKHAQIVALLLAKNADPNVTNAVGLTARQEAKGPAIDVYSFFAQKPTQTQITLQYPICSQLRQKEKKKGMAAFGKSFSEKMTSRSISPGSNRSSAPANKGFPPQRNASASISHETSQSISISSPTPTINTNAYASASRPIQRPTNLSSSSDSFASGSAPSPQTQFTPRPGPNGGVYGSPSQPSFGATRSRPSQASTTQQPNVQTRGTMTPTRTFSLQTSPRGTQSPLVRSGSPTTSETSSPNTSPVSSITFQKQPQQPSMMQRPLGPQGTSGFAGAPQPELRGGQMPASFMNQNPHNPSNQPPWNANGGSPQRGIPRGGFQPQNPPMRGGFNPSMAGTPPNFRGQGPQPMNMQAVRGGYNMPPGAGHPSGQLKPMQPLGPQGQGRQPLVGQGLRGQGYQGQGHQGQGHQPPGQGHQGQGHQPLGQGYQGQGHQPLGQGHQPLGQGHQPLGQGAQSPSQPRPISQQGQTQASTPAGPPQPAAEITPRPAEPMTPEPVAETALEKLARLRAATEAKQRETERMDDEKLKKATIETQIAALLPSHEITQKKLAEEQAKLDHVSAELADLQNQIQSTLQEKSEVLAVILSHERNIQADQARIRQIQAFLPMNQAKTTAIIAKSEQIYRQSAQSVMAKKLANAEASIREAQKTVAHTASEAQRAQVALQVAIASEKLASDRAKNAQSDLAAKQALLQNLKSEAAQLPATGAPVAIPEVTFSPDFADEYQYDEYESQQEYMYEDGYNEQEYNEQVFSEEGCYDGYNEQEYDDFSEQESNTEQYNEQDNEQTYHEQSSAQPDYGEQQTGEYSENEVAEYTEYGYDQFEFDGEFAQGEFSEYGYEYAEDEYYG